MDRISAFMDGEAAPAETRQALVKLRNDDECRKVWDYFHLLGDVMRGDPVLRNDFVERLRERLDEEPVVLSPRTRWRAPENFAYSAAAAAAGLAVVALVGMLVMPNIADRSRDNIASVPKQKNEQVAQSDSRLPPGAAPNQAQVNEYLMAHQEFSPSTALQGVLPYVRTVSESHDGSRR
jgi:sigma-E factor negative regulatory protein RseA